MLSSSLTPPRVHWRLLAIAVVALAITVIVGLFQVIPAAAPEPSAVGAFVSAAVMIAALVVFIGLLMFVLSEFLRSEEYAERSFARAGRAGARTDAPFVVAAPAPAPVPEVQQEQEGQQTM